MSILVLRHIENNTLGVLEPVLSARGLDFAYLHTAGLDASSFAQAVGLQNDWRQFGEHPPFQGLIVLGGRESVTEDGEYPFMSPEQHLIRECIGAGIPVFGICLGSQLMAKALGGSVRRNAVKEVGWVPLELTEKGKKDPVLSELDGMSQMQWHEDTFELPPAAIHLAMSRDCRNQAYKVNNITYSVQFHPEIDRATIEQWLRESESLSEEDRQAIREETEANFDRWAKASQAMFDRYLGQAYC